MIPWYAWLLVSLTAWITPMYPLSRVALARFIGDRTREDLEQIDRQNRNDFGYELGYLRVSAQVFAFFWPLTLPVIAVVYLIKFVFGGWKRGLNQVESRGEKARRLERAARKEKAALKARIDELERENQVGRYKP